MIIAQAIAQGFRDEIQDKVLGSTAHILVFENGESRISNWKVVEKKIGEVEGVETVEPTSFESSVIFGEAKSGHAILRVRDWKREAGIGSERTDATIPVALGKELAATLDLKVGDKFDLLIFDEKETPESKEVLLGRIFETGLYEYDSTWLYVTAEDYEKLRSESGFRPSVYSVSVKDIYLTEEISLELRQILGREFKVIDWQEANRPLFSALSLERKVTLAIILLIIFIAALNITTTLALLVNERRHDIGVLKTFGATTRSVVAIFLFEGLILSLLGILLGFVFGFVACLLGNYFKIISLSKEVYSLNYIPFNVTVASVLQVIIITFFVCLLAIIYPAIRAGRVKPIENLKTQ